MPASYDELLVLLRSVGGALVAFSGGVDSTLLLAAAHDALGERVLAVTAVSPTLPASDLASANAMAAQLGARWITLQTDELADPCFRANPPDRCYYCKKELFAKLLDIARREGLPVVLDGANADDLSDYRPGMNATRELGVRSPFIELGIGKNDIRRMARERGLPDWERPSSACLASRIPYGEEITVERLERIGRSEDALRALGFRQVRVRDHGAVARIEVGRDEMNKLLDEAMRDAALAACKQAGYRYVTLDLQGYRTGAMNETLPPEKKK
jgi:uncharacterized protein